MRSSTLIHFFVVNAAVLFLCGLSHPHGHMAKMPLVCTVKHGALSLPHLLAACSWLAMDEQAKSPWKLSRKESMAWYLVESESWASRGYPVEYLASACRGQQGTQADSEYG